MADKNPLVSIIIPTYNRAELLRYTVDSALYQTYENIEIIVVDDASTDQTESVISAYKDDRIEFITHTENKGANAARNTGLEFCNGVYICFLDSDEILLPEKIEKQVDILRESTKEVGAVYCSTYSEFGGCLKNNITGGKEGNIFSELLSFDIKILTTQLLIKVECFETCGRWDPELPSFNEYDLCLRIAQEYGFRYIEEPLVVSRYHKGDQISRNESDRINGLNKIINKWESEMIKHLGKDAPKEFQKMFITRWSRSAAIWKAQNNRRKEAIMRATKYLYRSRNIDIKFFIGFLLSLIDTRIYEYARKLWFCFTSTEKENNLEKYPSFDKKIEK